DTGDPNWYRALSNNPVNLVDPSGLQNQKGNAFAGFFFAGTGEQSISVNLIEQNEQQSNMMDGHYYTTPVVNFDSSFFFLRPLAYFEGASSSFLPSPHHDVSDDTDIREAINLALKAKRKGQRIVIVGWSRGAIRVLYMAQQLEKKGIEVDYLGLIDPVGTLY